MVRSDGEKGRSARAATKPLAREGGGRDAELLLDIRATLKNDPEISGDEKGREEAKGGRGENPLKFVWTCWFSPPPLKRCLHTVIREGHTNLETHISHFANLPSLAEPKTNQDHESPRMSPINLGTADRE